MGKNGKVAMEKLVPSFFSLYHHDWFNFQLLFPASLFCDSRHSPGVSIVSQGYHNLLIPGYQFMQLTTIPFWL